jgi:hypothetical protein
MSEFDGLPDHCPPDPSHVADLYLLKNLSPEQSAMFEAHFKTCARCLEEVDLARNFIKALKRYSGMNGAHGPGSGN